MLYKQRHIVKKLPTCSFEMKDLDLLINLCVNLHEECHKKMIQDITDKKINIVGIDYLNIEEVKEHIATNFLWTVELFGAKGEYLFIQDLGKLTSTDLPIKIEKFKFQNDSTYELFQKRRPSIYIDVTIDFKEVQIFDLISSPTQSTRNDSKYEVTGIDLTLVAGFSNRFEMFFKKYENYRGKINAQNSYDILLWLGFFPIMLALLLKYESHIPPLVTNSSVFIQVLLSIVCLFLSLYFFRCLFNLARWFFPCQELTTQVSKERKFAKILFSIMIAGIISTMAYNFFEWFSSKLLG